MSTVSAVAATPAGLLPFAALVGKEQPSELHRYFLEKLKDPRYRTKSKICEALGISNSSGWKEITEGKLGFLPILRFAEAEGENPRRLLEMTGKHDLADLLERIYGEPNGLSDVDHALIRLPAATKAAIVAAATSTTTSGRDGPPKEHRVAKGQGRKAG